MNSERIVDIPTFMLPCNKGPYIWDKSQHLDGIGSTIQWRKPSMFAAHILRGKWIGNLTNEHHVEEGDQSGYFGLSDLSDCNVNALKMHEKQKTMIFFRTTEHMFKKYIVEKKHRHQFNKTTVVIFNWEHTWIESNNFAVIDSSVRRRFHQKRLLRQTPNRKPNQYWVSIHFRWGDTKTTDPDNPGGRTGLSFKGYCACVHEILLVNPNVEIYFFAEGFPHPELCEHLKYKNIHFINESITWKRDIDIMSQSQLLIGGSSSFFVLGSHLCENCTVIHSSDRKFKKTEYEETLPKHLIETNCNFTLTCYLEGIKTTKTLVEH